MALGATRQELAVLLLISVVIAGGLVARSLDRTARGNLAPAATIPAPGPDWQPITEFTAGKPLPPGAIPSPPPDPSPLPAADPASPSAIDLNAATATDLERLPGIGPSRAEAILRVRSERGGFKTIDDLGAVPGIGPKGIERLRPYAVVKPPANAPTIPPARLTDSPLAPEPAAPETSSISESATSPDAPININTATAEELDAIPGVGPALAARIITHRNRHPFRSVEELIKVQGIGPKNLAKMRSHVKVRD